MESPPLIVDALVRETGLIATEWLRIALIASVLQR
jgi:hypothetical protein